MARHATIIGHVRDAWGDPWDVRESRPTKHGFALQIGWPAGCRGKGYGGPRAIPTPELVAYLERHRRDAGVWDLPIGRTAVKRLRRLLGHNRYIDAAEWWEDRAADLATLTLEQFAAKHGRKVGAVERARLALYGKTNRDHGWYRQEPARSLLIGNTPRAEVADRLGISIGAVGRLRWVLRSEG